MADFIEFDLILAMDLANLNALKALQIQAEKHYGAQALQVQLALMSEHDRLFPQQPLPDPYYGEAEGFERVIDQCESSSRAWVAHFQQQRLSTSN